MVFGDLFMAIGSSLSIFCGLLVLGSHARSSKRPLKAFDYPILAIALSDMCFCVGYFVGEENCKVAEIMNGTGCLCSVLFTSAVSWLVFLSSIGWRSSLNYFFWWYCAFCLSLSVFAGFIPYILGSVRQDVCWVSAANSFILDLTRFLTFYTFFVVVLGWSLVVFCCVRPKNQLDLDAKVLAANRRRTQLYPVSLLLTFGLMFFVRVLESSEVPLSRGFLFQFASVLTTFSGVSNAFVYFITDEKAELRMVMVKLLGRD